MTRTARMFVVVVGVCLLAAGARPAAAQVFEAAGSRALGMGGAFVGVADDSSATWWNPGALAAGPFLDLALGRTALEVDDSLPAARERSSYFALATPPFGFSYYRLRITDIRLTDPTAATPPDREGRRAGMPVRSLSVHQLGVTLVHTLVPGVHAGTTLKYVRGTLRVAESDGEIDPSRLLERGDDLEGAEGHGAFDLDVGVLGVAGPFRIGAVLRNATAPELGAARLERQVRVGAAFDGDAAGWQPWMFSADADLDAYETGTGPRRVIAVGAERWLRQRRVGIRGGARFNTVGAQERAGSAGVSVAVRSGVFVDAHIVQGGTADEQGWGVTARVSF